jgi:hypothetical protein
VVQKTVQAIEKIEAIRVKRQDRFHELRMRRARQQQAASDRATLEKEIHLIKAPASLLAAAEPAAAEPAVEAAAVPRAKEPKLRVRAAQRQRPEAMQE